MLEDSEVSKCSAHAITVYNSHTTLQMSRCVVADNDWHGLCMGDGSKGSFSECDFVNNDDPDFGLVQADCEIEVDQHTLDHSTGLDPSHAYVHLIQPNED